MNCCLDIPNSLIEVTYLVSNESHSCLWLRWIVLSWYTHSLLIQPVWWAASHTAVCYCDELFCTDVPNPLLFQPITEVTSGEQWVTHLFVTDKLFCADMAFMSDRPLNMVNQPPLIEEAHLTGQKGTAHTATHTRHVTSQVPRNSISLLFHPEDTAVICYTLEWASSWVWLCPSFKTMWNEYATLCTRNLL